MVLSVSYYEYGKALSLPSDEDPCTEVQYKFVAFEALQCKCAQHLAYLAACH